MNDDSATASAPLQDSSEMSETDPLDPSETGDSASPIRRRGGSEKGRKIRRKIVHHEPQSASEVAIISTSANGRNTYDWPFLKRMFIEGIPEDPDKPDGKREWLNLRELSERFGVSYQQVRDHSADERWRDIKTEYQAKVMKKRQAQRASRMFEVGTEFDDLALDVGQRGMQLVQFRLTEMIRDGALRDQRRRQIMDAGGDVADMEDALKELRSAVSADQLEKLAKAAAMFQEVGMKAIGTDITQIQVSGPGGDPIQHAVSVAAELERDDPNRLAGFMSAALRTGFMQEMLSQQGVQTNEQGEIIEGDFTETEDEELPPMEYVEPSTDDLEDDRYNDDENLPDSLPHDYVVKDD